ncbi:MAG: GGDEF domain-containing protein, partial [Fimbriimonadaceae bacterium]|nr:GGDEF domain-containing protein [Alphaproteobacteria bacterium]
ALTGLYSRGFLFEHLNTMIREAGEIADAFSLATFTIRDMAGLNDAYGYATGDRMIRQIGDLMGLLTRGEDLTARYSGARFVAVLPDTPPDEAEVAVNRILGVIRHTEFSVPEIEGSIQIDMSAGITGFTPGDDPQSLISRSISWIKT